MSTDSFFRDSSFSPEVVMILASAFDSAWEVVKLSGGPLTTDGNATSTREILAKRIIETARQGELNPKWLTDDAIAYLQHVQSGD
jgi:hypothetical protein